MHIHINNHPSPDHPLPLFQARAAHASTRTASLSPRLPSTVALRQPLRSSLLTTSLRRHYALLPQADLVHPITPPPPSASTAPSSPLPVLTPKKRGILSRLIRGTVILNVTLFILGLVGAGGLYVYYSWVAPALSVYKRSKEGITYAVGVYDRGKGWYSCKWARRLGF